MSGPITNLSFETSTDGTNPDGWTFAFQSSVEELDDFAAGVFESFESGWGTTFEGTVVAGVNGTAEHFTNPVGVVPILADSFEVGWSNNAFTTELLGEADIFTGAMTFDGFETWSVFEPVFGSSVTNPFASTSGHEDFETGWRNGFYAYTIDFIGTGVHWAGDRNVEAESFEYVELDQPCTIDTSGGGTEGQITFPTPHGYFTGFSCQVYSPNGTLAAGLLPGVRYAVTVVSSTVITLSLGSVLVAPTAQGTGVLYVTDPYEFWTTELSF